MEKDVRVLRWVKVQFGVKPSEIETKSTEMEIQVQFRMMASANLILLLGRTLDMLGSNPQSNELLTTIVHFFSPCMSFLNIKN